MGSKTPASTFVTRPKVASTKKNYDAAAETLAKLRSEFEKSISGDADLVAAQKALEEAKAKSKEADDKVADATKDLAKQKAARETALAEQRKVDREYNQAKQRAASARKY